MPGKPRSIHWPGGFNYLGMQISGKRLHEANTLLTLIISAHLERISGYALYGLDHYGFSQSQCSDPEEILVILFCPKSLYTA